MLKHKREIQDVTKAVAYVNSKRKIYSLAYVSYKRKNNQIINCSKRVETEKVRAYHRHHVGKPRGPKHPMTSLRAWSKNSSAVDLVF